MRDRTVIDVHLRRHGICWLMAVGLAALAAVLLGLPRSAGARTASPSATPTLSPTPQRTGDLGNVTVAGRVYDDALGSVGGGIEGAQVSYGGRDPGAVETDANGEFAFSLFLHDTDSVRIEASAEGFATQTHVYSALDLYFGEPVEFALQRSSGEIDIQPQAWQSLPCEADATVTITNRSSDEPLTITAILASNSYSQGDYGTGFTSDLSAIELPLTLAPGAQVSFPVHYSAAGQDFPSRLTVRVDSTAHNAGFAVPYRGPIAGCGAPTPTPTATPPAGPCAGDCDGDRLVTIAELVHGVALALGRPVSPCAAADLDANGLVVVNELVAAVAAAADGCR